MFITRTLYIDFWETVIIQDLSVSSSLYHQFQLARVLCWINIIIVRRKSVNVVVSFETLMNPATLESLNPFEKRLNWKKYTFYQAVKAGLFFFVPEKVDISDRNSMTVDCENALFPQKQGFRRREIGVFSQWWLVIVLYFSVWIFFYHQFLVAWLQRWNISAIYH